MTADDIKNDFFRLNTPYHIFLLCRRVLVSSGKGKPIFWRHHPGPQSKFNIIGGEARQQIRVCLLESTVEFPWVNCNQKINSVLKD